MFSWEQAAWETARQLAEVLCYNEYEIAEALEDAGWPQTEIILFIQEECS